VINGDAPCVLPPFCFFSFFPPSFLSMPGGAKHRVCRAWIIKRPTLVLYIYTYIYIYIYIYICVCMYICMYVCMYIEKSDGLLNRVALSSRPQRARCEEKLIPWPCSLRVLQIESAVLINAHSNRALNSDGRLPVKNACLNSLINLQFRLLIKS